LVGCLCYVTFGHISIISTSQNTRVVSAVFEILQERQKTEYNRHLLFFCSHIWHKYSSSSTSMEYLKIFQKLLLVFIIFHIRPLYSEAKTSTRFNIPEYNGRMCRYVLCILELYERETRLFQSTMVVCADTTVVS
jgi:hypothetical protein